MSIYRLGEREPNIDPSAFVFPSADLIGDVRIGPEVYIGPGARLRGDYGTIIIGERSAVEDNCVIHARPEDECRLGSHVTVGHGAVLHNCDLRDWALVGMGSVVSDFAIVEEWGVVAEGAVVRNRFKVPGRRIAAGVPAKIIGEIDDQYIKTWTRFKGLYNQFANSVYPAELELLEPSR